MFRSRNQQTISELPSAEFEPERYQGRPLLILLENYVLDSIGALTPERSGEVGKVVQQTFGGGPDWRETLRRRFWLDDSLDDSIRTLWERNQEVAHVRGEAIRPIQFAKMMVDTNFAYLIDDDEANTMRSSAE